MSFRTKRVLFSVPFYIIFQFFLLKYIFLLFGGIDNVILIVISVLIGLMRCIPMFFEERKSTNVGRFFQTVDGIWMWASLMFLIDVVLIYVLNSFITLPKFIVYILLAIVPVLGVYNYYNATKLI